MSELNRAAENNDIEKVKNLLREGWDVSSCGRPRRTTPLIIACNKGYKELAKFLIDKGADVTMGDKDGLTALLGACGNGDKELVELLLKKGADINTSDDYDNTPLPLACGSGNKELVELLINKGADVKYKDYWNNTALKICKRQQEATKGQIWSEIKELLEKHGANNE